MNQCVESSKAGAITKALNDVMVVHLGLGLIRHESYDPKAIQQVDNDLTKFVLDTFSFSLLESLRSSDRLVTFDEILASIGDKDEDYL